MTTAFATLVFSIGFLAQVAGWLAGFVWINGSKCPPPQSIAGLRYASEVPLFTSMTTVFHLDEEYCVLGDNTMESADGRFFGPVPKDHAVGVVTHIYWPKDRIRVLR